MNIEQWSELMDAFGFPANADTFRALESAYSERHRHYHTGKHIRDCLAQLDVCVAMADEPKEIALALWFHDAIYRPLAADNERKSADWAKKFLADNHAPAAMVSRIEHLIMATRHNVPTRTKDESILIDIDLSILGSDPITYSMFERAVRKEYRIVPSFIYRKKRADILRSFLRRKVIYQNEPLHSKLEQQARTNLVEAIAQLAGE